METDEALLNLSLQPLSLDVGETESPRMPVGSPIEVNGIEVDPEGAFEVALGEVSLPGAANPISGSDIVAQLSLRGKVLDENTICGEVEGMIQQPITAPFDYSNSTFGAVRLAEGEEFPAFEEMLLACPEGE